MKYKAMILNNNPKSVDYVYGQEQLAKINDLTDLLPGVVSHEMFKTMDVANVEIIFSTWGMVSLTDEEIARMPKLKAVFYAAGATDYFARPFLHRKVKVISAWLANAIPVAEFTVAQIALGMKGFFYNTRLARQNKVFSNAGVGPGVYGEEVALIGAGAISAHVQKLLQNYKLKVTVVPSRPERRTVSIDEVFQTAFVVSNHLPNREDNQKVLTKAHFASMRQGAVFINTGRGAQVDEEGMLDVLADRPDLTALIDVTHPEPPAADSRLFTLPNVYLSGHIAGSTNDEVHRMSDYVIEDLERMLANEPLQYQVTEAMLMTS